MTGVSGNATDLLKGLLLCFKALIIIVTVDSSIVNNKGGGRTVHGFISSRFFKTVT